MPVIGADDVIRKFSRLSQDLKGRAGRRMVASSSNVIRKEAKIVAQNRGLKRSGAMIKNIALKRERKTPSHLIQYNVGVRHGHNIAQKKAHLVKRRKENPKYIGVRNGRYLDDPFYWWFVHNGRNIYKNRNRKSGVVGRVQGVPFLTIALNRKRKRVFEVQREVLNGVLKKVSR